MKDWIEFQLLKICYAELKNKSERHGKQLSILERSRIDLRKRNSKLWTALRELYEPAKIAVNQIICMGGDDICQPCENREKLAIALDKVEKLLRNK